MIDRGISGGITVESASGITRELSKVLREISEGNLIHFYDKGNP